MHNQPMPSPDQPVAEELAALRRELASVHARLDRVTRRPRRRGRLARLLPLGIVALLVALVPLAALAVNPFTDLTGGPHDGNIDAIFNAGITTGCGPTNYCPTANVTREEMASFLARTAGIGTNKPVANAARLATTNPTAGGTTYAANELVRVARGSGVIFPTTVPMTATATTIGAVTITAPGPGFVLVTSSAIIRDLAGSSNIEVTLREGGGAQVSTGMTVLAGNDPGRLAIQTTSPTWVFSVPAAGARTYQLQGQLMIGTGVDAYDATLTAIFVPFGSTGGSALGVSNPSPTDGGDETQP